MIILCKPFFYHLVLLIHSDKTLKRRRRLLMKSLRQLINNCKSNCKDWVKSSEQSSYFLLCCRHFQICCCNVNHLMQCLLNQLYCFICKKNIDSWFCNKPAALHNCPHNTFVVFSVSVLEGQICISPDGKQLQPLLLCLIHGSHNSCCMIFHRFPPNSTPKPGQCERRCKIFMNIHIYINKYS